VLVEHSRLELDLGAIATAESLAARATRLLPEDALAWLAFAECALARRDREALRARLDRALAADWHGMDNDRARAAAARAAIE
jgi:hypothetical protein